MEFSMDYKVNVNGLRINCKKLGFGQQNVLLMTRGFGSSNDFTPQLGGMDKEQFTFVAYDPPGYGLSRPPERDFNNNFFRKDAEIAAQLMKNLGMYEYSVLGWDDGGTTAMIVAAENRDCVDKLVVWGAKAYVTDEDRNYLTSQRDISKWNSYTRGSFLNAYGEELFDNLWTSYIDRYLEYDDICKAYLKRIKCPTLILHGDLDVSMAKEHPDFLVNHIKNARLHRFYDGGHDIHQRNAHEFNKVVTEFLLD